MAASFFDIDINFGFAQFFLLPLILSVQLLVPGCQRVMQCFRSALLQERVCRRSAKLPLEAVSHGFGVTLGSAGAGKAGLIS